MASNVATLPPRRAAIDANHQRAMQELRGAMKPAAITATTSTERIELAGYEACKLVIELCDSGRLVSRRRYSEAMLYVNAYESKQRSRA